MNSKKKVKSAPQRVRKTAFPCPVCDKACASNTIYCDICGLWVHRECVPMSEAVFTDISSKSDYFLCPKCVTSTDDNQFDWLKCLDR